MATDTIHARRRLGERVRAATQLDDPRILSAFERVPRHEFLAETQLAIAYDDRAVPLDEGQTVSQPSMIAIMLKELECEPHQRALEVGAGSGYAAALLGELVSEVYAVEVRSALAARARENLRRVSAHNVHVFDGDGSWGLPEHAPYDRILVSAAPERVPSALIEQLKVGGRIAIPVGNEHTQTLLVGRKTESHDMEWQKSVPCIFVPLVNRT